MYYNSASLWFDTMNEAKEYILKNDLIWFDMNNSYNAMINIVHHRTVWNGLKRFETVWNIFARYGEQQTEQHCYRAQILT